MSKKAKSYRFTLRFDCDFDADLVEWLESQPDGKRSEAVRELMRQGLRAAELRADLNVIVEHALRNALSELNVSAVKQTYVSERSEIEDVFGARLDEMLDGFG